MTRDIKRNKDKNDNIFIFRNNANRDNRATSLEWCKEKNQARLLYPAKIFLKEYFSKNVFQNASKIKMFSDTKK